MNLKEIKDIVNSDIPETQKRLQIIKILADDPNSLMMVIQTIHLERLMKNDIISELNLHLSKADCILDNPNLHPDTNMLKEISDFYIKYSDFITHCFKSNNGG